MCDRLIIHEIRRLACCTELSILLLGIELCAMQFFPPAITGGMYDDMRYETPLEILEEYGGIVEAPLERMISICVCWCGPGIAQ